MKENFADSLEFTLSQEGGFANNPHDPGGRTMEGITQRTYDAWCDKNKIVRSNVRNIPVQHVGLIYHQYWQDVGADELPTGVDLVMFDIGVMSGPHTALLFFKHGATSYTQLNFAHLRFLEKLSTWQDFGYGWSHRLNKRENAAKALIAKVSPAGNGAKSSEVKVIPAPQSKGNTMLGNVMMLPSVVSNIIGVALQYGPTVASSVATTVSNFPDIEAKGKDMIARLKRFDVPGAVVDFNAIWNDLGLTPDHLAAVFATAAHDGAVTTK